MKRLLIWPAACVLLPLLTAIPVSAQTLDEVVQRHIDAHGGKAAWQSVQSLRLTGSFTAFSETRPFTLVRGPARQYLFDRNEGDKRVIAGYDGNDAWWINPWYGFDWALPITGADRVAFERDLDLPTPFFDYQELGHALELKGMVDYEGEQLLQVDLTRSDGSTEQWYLDPATCLEKVRVSPGSDFGTAVPQRTYFDDFRSVGKLVLAHAIESQWYSRDRMMEIEQVERDVPIDPELFAFPAPTGMAQLQTMIGDWQVAVEQRMGPRSPWTESTRHTTINGLVRGALLEERSVTGDGYELVTTLSYDRYRDHYNLTELNGLTTHLNVMHGLFEDGRLSLSDVETGTTWELNGRTINQRTSFFDITEHGFHCEREISFDGGESWILLQKATYTRAGSEPAPDQQE